MDTTKKVFLVLRVCMERTFSDRRMVVLFLVIGFILDNGVQTMVKHALQVGQPLGIFEGFIMCLNHWYYLVTFCVGFIFILADIPRLDSGQHLVVYRTGKKPWLIGEILQIALSALCYVLTLLVGCVIVCARYSYWGNVWSNFTVNYKAEYEEILTDNNRFVDQQVFKYYLPFPSVIHGVLLLTLCLTLMGMVILLFSIVYKKLIGIILNVILIIFVIIFNQYHTSWIMWLSPFCHAVLFMHNTYVYKKLSVPLVFSYAYLMLWHIVIFGISMKILRNKSF